MTHAVQTIGGNYNAVMTLQVTSLRTVKHINEAIELFSQDGEADSSASLIKFSLQMLL